jgi:hypothetical protein
MKVLQDYILNPFGSGNSCIDTVDGECIRDMSLEECKSKCESADNCHLGMYIKPPWTKSYCLPYNTIDYLNRPLSRLLVHKKNNSKFSSDKNVDMHLFFNEKVYPSLTVPEQIILNHAICHLQIRKDNVTYYVSNQLTLTTSIPTVPFVFGLGQHSYIRLMNGMNLFWTNYDRTEIVTCNFETKLFDWKPVTALPDDENQFCVKQDNEFIDLDQDITLTVSQGEITYFLAFEPTLTLSTKKPNYSMRWIKAGDPAVPSIDENTTIMENYLKQISNNSPCNNGLYLAIIIFVIIFIFVILLLYKWKCIQLF